MINIEIVKGAYANTLGKFEQRGEYGHGTAVSMRLVEPWRGSGRTVYGDSFFGSVECATALKEEFGLYFTGVVKSCYAGYPLCLKDCYLEGQGYWKSITTTTPKGTELQACTWSDRNRHYFISTCSTCCPGEDHIRCRWVNSSKSTDEGVMKTEKRISIPQLAAEYFEYNDMVDRHNRRRQADLNLEKKFEVKEWVFRVISSIIGVIVTNAYLYYKGSRSYHGKPLPMKAFINRLAGEMVTNTFDGPVASRVKRDAKIEKEAKAAPVPSYNCKEVKKLPKPTKNTKKVSSGKAKTLRAGRIVCVICKIGTKKTPWMCDTCPLDHKMKGTHVHPGKCFDTHLRNVHGVILIE